MRNTRAAIPAARTPRITPAAFLMRSHLPEPYPHHNFPQTLAQRRPTVGALPGRPTVSPSTLLPAVNPVPAILTRLVALQDDPASLPPEQALKEPSTRPLPCATDLPSLEPPRRRRGISASPLLPSARLRRDAKR